jgi:hypothetical protein
MSEELRLSFKASVKMKKDCILQLCEWHAVKAIKKAVSCCWSVYQEKTKET